MPDVKDEIKKEDSIKDPKSWSFISELLRYYKEFLETDFRSRFKPKRRVLLSKEEGLMGVDLTRFPGLNELVLGFLTNKFHIPKLEDIDDGEVPVYVSEKAISAIEQLIEDHGKVNQEKLIEQILDLFEDFLKKEKFLDEPNLLYSRTELKSQLKALTPNKYASVIKKYRLLDFYRDITLILQTKKLTDKTDFYFYFYDIKFDGETYPLFYIPVSVEHPPLQPNIRPHYSLNFEGSPVLYVNEKAIQYIAERISESERYKVKIDLPKRQIYWNDSEDLPPLINDIFTKLSDRFKLTHFDLSQKNVNIENDHVKITSKCYLTVFDKSDEAIINDYEALQLLLQQDNSIARELFNKLIMGFLLENPKVVTLDVDEEFDKLGIGEKLTFKSPISLNPEQIKILEALKKNEVRNVIVEGPPGTGKSHTITAIIYDALLNGKSVLVASDKKEALDVVEEKITDVLEKIKVDEGYVQNPILRLGQAENNFNKIFQTQNFEKIKERFNAYKFSFDQIQNQITERIQQMQDDINREIGTSKDSYGEILDAAQNVIQFEHNKLDGWKKLVDLDEIKDETGYGCLERLWQTTQLLNGNEINLKNLPATWLQEHSDEDATTNIKATIDTLNEISSLSEKIKNKGRIKELIDEITSNKDCDWGSIGNIHESVSKINSFFADSEKEVFIKKANETLALEEISQLAMEIEALAEAFNKAHQLYNHHISKFGQRTLSDLDDKNIVILEEYLLEIKKIKSFLWQITKRSQIESLNQKLEMAFPASDLKNPHSMIPQLESEVLINGEINKLRSELSNNSLVMNSLFELKNLNKILEEKRFEDLEEKLKTLLSGLKEAEGLINKSKILDACKRISSNKKVLTTNELLEDFENGMSIMQLINRFDDLFAQVNPPIFDNIKENELDSFMNRSYIEKLIDGFVNLSAAVSFVSDKDGMIESLLASKEAMPQTIKKLDVDPEDVATLKTSKISNISHEELSALISYVKDSAKVFRFYENIGPSHYNLDRSLLQNRFIANMTYILDKKVVNFRTTRAGDAQEIKKIIRAKSQIPKQYLHTLIEAFPCLIVNIRELGEYIPLEPELFDLVIIDEASQVSIAQAFPALLRAKKVVVLGDTKQFSNVKTSTASIPINNEAFSTVRDSYSKDLRQVEEDTRDAIKGKIARFNIKNSILDFMQAIANYQTMLLKHFRCYKEIISYSNHQFYADRLQVMKLRGKNVQDVIRFEIVDDCSEPTVQSGVSVKIIENANENEAKFILKDLEKLADKGVLDSVGVITPFRNQQKYIYEMLRNSPKYSYFEEKMKLKVMTFDTCQGEERDRVYYSMVESPSNSSRLSTIFAKALSNDDEEGKLREQRLNVGFSRCKECAVFVLSKPVEDFKGEVGTAVRHFKDELDRGLKLPKPTEMESEGEKMLLNLVEQTVFCSKNKDWINIQAQFPIGEYLRAINKADIPKYRTDFLLTFSKPDSKPVNIILEYDGFEYHFQQGYDVNRLNYDDYYVAQNIERMKALETYGYEFVRLNKFMLADNPIEVLDQKFDFIVKKRLK